jgi:hypothetical protein
MGKLKIELNPKTERRNSDAQRNKPRPQKNKRDIEKNIDAKEYF